MRRAWTWLIVLFIGGALALSPQAAKLLDQAAAYRKQAEATYKKHYPDLDLWKKAIWLGEKAAKIDPEAPEVWRFLAEVYTETGWWIRAAEAWQKYLELGGATTPEALAEVYKHLGYAAYQRGALDEAIAWYEKALKVRPDDAEAAAWLGRIYVEKGDPKAALKYWQLAAKLEPSPKNRYFLKLAETMARYGTQAARAFYQGYAAYERGDLETALLFFKRAADLAPGWLEPRRWLARIYLEAGLPQEALPYWEEVYKAEPTPENAHFLKLAREAVKGGVQASQAFFEGLAAYEKGDLAAAQAAFERAVELNPDYAKAWKWLGRVAFERGDFATAVRAYREALRLNPDDRQAKYFLRLAERALKSGGAPQGAP